MDIDYLLTLQEIRHSLPSPVELVAVGISYIGEGPLLVALALIVYWCIDKRMGLLGMAAMASGNFVNQLLKNLVCVYRPWIRDPRIIPAEAAIEGAGGYSFPSGHCTGVASVLGAFAWQLRKHHKGVSALCIVVILVVAFSRNLLGVHTPQDVVVGLLLGVIAIVAVNAFANWIERYDALMPGHNKDVLVTIIVVIICAASIAVVLLKPYPMDYVDGQLLVDPGQMQKGSFEAAGLFSGLALGWLLERRFVSFATRDVVDRRTRMVRGILGVGIVGITYFATDKLFKAVLPYVWAKLFAMFTLVLVAVFVVPLLFSAIERRRENKQVDGKPAAHGRHMRQ